MKFILIITLFTASFSAISGVGADLLAAREAAIDEASVELNLDNLQAIEALPTKSNEVLIKFKVGENISSFNCHYHGSDMACHGKDDGHESLNSQDGFEYFMEGHYLALSKFEKTLKRKGSDLESLRSIKSWVHKSDDNDDGHEHGADIWTKVTYNLDEKLLTVFIQCHEHGNDGKMACHYKRSGKEEPSL